MTSSGIRIFRAAIWVGLIQPRETYRSGSRLVAWIRYRHHILKANLKRPEELTVAQVAERFGVSHHVVYYWLEHDLLKGRRPKPGAPYWITIDNTTEQKLLDWVGKSARIQTPRKAKNFL